MRRVGAFFSETKGNVMRTIFVVHGPMEVPFYRGKAARTITDDNVKEFWRKHPEIGKKRGCYVFGIRASKGYRVGYVGRATKSFKGETFSPHKLTRYQQFLADYLAGTPVLFFLALPQSKGKPNLSAISTLEAFLIQVGLAANPDLLNVRGTRKEEWAIGGVLRARRGKPSASAIAFRKMMKMS